MNQDKNIIGRLVSCPLCGQGNLLNGRGVQVHIYKKHPEERNKTKWLSQI